MKVALLRVGIDTGSGGIHGPLFQDGSFEYIPIPDGFLKDERTYSNTLGKHGKNLISYFPESRIEKMADQSIHFDPEFSTFTYGDPTPPKAGLRNLQPGDLLVFYCGLCGWDCQIQPALFLIGYFEILTAGLAKDFSSTDLHSLFRQNFHVRHKEIFEKQKDKLVLVKGSPQSRLFDKAVCISSVGYDRSGRPLKVLSPEMQMIFGSFNGKISFQRSPTRWVDPLFVTKAADYVRSL